MMNTPDNTERDAKICAAYKQGMAQAEIARFFGVSRARIYQILKKAKLWQPHVRLPKGKHLGVVLDPETKETLRAKADGAGRSMSEFAADVIKEALK